MDNRPGYVRPARCPTGRPGRRQGSARPGEGGDRYARPGAGWRSPPRTVILPRTSSGADALLATAFDPLAAARSLKDAGFESEQAEALAAQLRFAAGADHADLATKADLKADLAELRADFKADLAELQATTKADLAALRADMQADNAELEKRLRADLDGLRSELGTVRWAVGLMAAFLFVIGLRVFGLI